jgi:hypothetical protein
MIQPLKSRRLFQFQTAMLNRLSYPLYFGMIGNPRVVVVAFVDASRV